MFEFLSGSAVVIVITTWILFGFWSAIHVIFYYEIPIIFSINVILTVVFVVSYFYQKIRNFWFF